MSNRTVGGSRACGFGARRHRGRLLDVSSDMSAPAVGPPHGSLELQSVIQPRLTEIQDPLRSGQNVASLVSTSRLGVWVTVGPQRAVADQSEENIASPYLSQGACQAINASVGGISSPPVPGLNCKRETPDKVRGRVFYVLCAKPKCPAPTHGRYQATGPTARRSGRVAWSRCRVRCRYLMTRQVRAGAGSRWTRL